MKARCAILFAAALAMAAVPAARLAAAADIQAAEVGVAVVTTYPGHDAPPIRSLRLFNLGDAARISSRDYPESFFPFGLERDSRDAWIRQNGRLILISGFPKGDRSRLSRLYIYSVDSSLGLRLAGELDSLPEATRGSNSRGEGGEERQVVSFRGNELVVRGTVSETRKGEWGNDYRVAREIVSRYSLGADGKLVLIEDRAADDGRELTRAAWQNGNARFVGSGSGLWEALELSGYDWKRADPIVKRMERHFASAFSAEAVPSFRIIGDRLALSYSLHCYIYDLALDELVEAPAASIYFEPDTIRMGNTLFVLRDSGSIAAFDLSDVAHPRSLKTTDRAFSLGRATERPVTIFGDTISIIGEDSFVSRWRLGSDGSISALHPAEELFAAIDSGDLSCIRDLISGDVDPVSARLVKDGEESALSHCVTTGRLTALKVIAEGEKAKGRAFARRSGYAHNPVLDALKAKNHEALRLLLSAFPGLATAVFENPAGRNDSLTPFLHAVVTGDVGMARELVVHGASPKDTAWSWRGPRNALSLLGATSGATPSASPAIDPSEMKAYLLSLGVPSAITLREALAAKAHGDSNRLRASPGLDGAILGKTMDGEAVSILEVSAEWSTINGESAPWYKIKTKAGIVGWSFGAFYYVPAWDGD